MNDRMNVTGQYLTQIAYTNDRQEAELLRKPIGRWGRMWQEWVKTEYPTEVQVYITEGRWQIIPRLIDREAEARFSELDEQYRKGNPRPATFAEIQAWEKMRLLNIEHQIMEETVFYLRS